MAAWTAFFGVVGGILTVVLWWLKWRSSPEQVTQRALEIRHLSDEETHDALLKIHDNKLEELRAQMDKLESDLAVLNFRAGLRKEPSDASGGTNH